MEYALPCIHCKGNNYYRDKYKGYCLDCHNCGVPDLVAQLAEAERLITMIADTPIGGRKTEAPGGWVACCQCCMINERVRTWLAGRGK